MNEQAAPNVGMIIRELRKRRGMSLRALASGCGLSINAISKIERGENSPTVLSLHRLATTLEVPISALFQEEIVEPTIFIKRDEGLRREIGGMIMQSLGSGLPQQQLEPFLITIEPGTRRENNPVTHYGEEFVYCLEGNIEYHINDEIYTLSKGDSLIFKASQAHYWNNLSSRRAKAILVFQASQAKHLLHQHSGDEV
ncbi:MAG: helix-turn-helix transcriptional regulator [Fidelibacterota bacterium]|nr:MAG: helix-turn-helix transcriptional regulator [Candidatus Neomarinimicrobiota bacterium]